MSEPGIRRYSTNHLMGEGYWVWLIQLATGPISIGVCADPRSHPYEEINELDRLLGWLRKHEPQLAASVEQRQEDIEDFLRVRDFAYGVKQAFSTDRWSLVGEAAAFADPFYSPGSDFIGYSNTFTDRPGDPRFERRGDRGASGAITTICTSASSSTSSPATGTHTRCSATRGCSAAS